MNPTETGHNFEKEYVREWLENNRDTLPINNVFWSVAEIFRPGPEDEARETFNDPEPFYKPYSKILRFT